MEQNSSTGNNQVDVARRYFNNRVGKYMYLGRSKSVYWASKRRFRSI